MTTTTTQPDTSWLPQVAANSVSDKYKTVFSLDLDGQQWAVATDARVLVAVMEPNDYPTMPDKLATAALDWLALKDGYKVSFAAIREWADTSMVGKCKWCLGTGKHTEVKFDEEGNIVDPDKQRPGMLSGKPVDRNLLALPLHYLEAPDNGEVEIVQALGAKAVQHSTGEEWPIGIFSERWRIVIMPMAKALIPNLELLPKFPAAAMMHYD